MDWKYGAQISLKENGSTEHKNTIFDNICTFAMFTNYDTAAPNTMVVGHLLARLNQHMFNYFPKNIKTFCIGKFIVFIY